MFAAALGQALQLPAPKYAAIQSRDRGPFIVAHASRQDSSRLEVLSPPSDDAFIVSLQLRTHPAFEVRVDGRTFLADPAREGSFSLFDLRSENLTRFEHAFEVLMLYVPRLALDAIAADDDVPRIGSLDVPPGKALHDAVVWHLGSSLLPALHQPGAANRLFFEHVSLALHSHLARTYGRMSPLRRSQRGGLTPRQERKAKEMLLGRLADDISLQELADACGLSRSHFARAFKQTTGQPPHRWLLQRRIDYARDLLAQSRMPIADIATRLGFADQSHFTRTFARTLGVTPAAWRHQVAPARGGARSESFDGD